MFVITPSSLHVPTEAAFFAAQLPERPSTGYCWEVEALNGATVVADSWVDDNERLTQFGAPTSIEPPADDLVGGTVDRVLVFKRMTDSGSMTLRHHQPWTPESTTESLVITW